MKGKPILHILYEFAGHFSEFGRQFFFKGLTQNYVPKLKVEMQFYVDSENFM